MSNEEKEQIALAVERYKVEKKVSNADLAKKAKLNPAMITHVLGRKFDNYSNGTPIPDNVFTALAKAMGAGVDVVETESYKSIAMHLIKLKQFSMAGLIDGDTGTGKSFGVDTFLQRFPVGNFRIKAAADFSPGGFIKEVAKELGLNIYQSQYDLRGAVQEKLASIDRPLLIVDEAENLADYHYTTIKALYDALEGMCGIALVGANKYKQKLQVKARRARTKNDVFPQIYSRFKTHTLNVPPMGLKDIELAANAFGVGTKAKIQELQRNCDDYRALFGTLRLEKEMAEMEVANG